MIGVGESDGSGYILSAPDSRTKSCGNEPHMARMKRDFPRTLWICIANTILNTFLEHLITRGSIYHIFYILAWPKVALKIDFLQKTYVVESTSTQKHGFGHAWCWNSTVLAFENGKRHGIVRSSNADYFWGPKPRFLNDFSYLATSLDLQGLDKRAFSLNMRLVHRVLTSIC